MDKTISIYSLEELILYLNDINEYVNSILLYHCGYNELDLEEILIYLSCVNEIIEAIKVYLCKIL